jgi:hypothetical protein
VFDRMRASWVADEAAQALADVGGVIEGSRVGWEVEENLDN